MVNRDLTPDNIKKAIENLKGYRLGNMLDKVDGNEAHRILPVIWPMIQELRLLSDACEKDLIKPVG